MKILHPYNFVPLASSVVKEAWVERPTGHERFRKDRHSGTMECKLDTHSLLCIKKVFEQLKSKNKPPYIPGSSLKGMVRTVAQVLGAGCGYKYRSMGGPAQLGSLDPCTSRRACLACRVFGYSAEREEFGWAGKVRFSDAKFEGVRGFSQWQEMEKGGGRWPTQRPPTKHAPFYFVGGDHNKPAGWKVYRHARNARAASVAQDACFWTPASVGKGTSFRFDVTYENLTVEEMAVLCFALTLSHECPEHGIAEVFQGQQLAHKLGYGKPAGLGSCSIAIIGDTRENPARYFGNAAPGPAAATGPCPLRGYFAAPAFAQFREYLSLSSAADHLLFPTKGRGLGWFDTNPTDSILAYETTGVTKWARVRITGVAGAGITCQTERGGSVYVGSSSPWFDGLSVGNECFVWITKWDDLKRTFEGITA